MAKLLIVVDMQNDFIDGSLGTKEAVAIVPNVVKKIRKYQEENGRIIFTKDTHFEDYLETQEGKNLPVPHCVKGTSGWELCNGIKEILDETDYKVYEKKSFASSELGADIQAGLYDDVTAVELVGLCTDICVVSNALYIKALRPEMPISVDGSCCAGVTPQTHQDALSVLKMCQVSDCSL